MLARLRTARRRTVVGLLARYAWMQARRVREQPAGFRPAPADAGPGWHVHEWRHIRGLPPLPGSQWSGTSGRQGPEGD
jgi:hypothetical protein